MLGMPADFESAFPMNAHETNVWIHVGAGAIALAVGAIPLLSTKGGLLHRRAGSAFVALGAVVLASALVGIVFFDPPAPLVAAGLTAGYQYLSSLRALHLRKRGPQLLDAVLALAGLAAAAALFLFMGTGTASWTPALGYSVIGVVAIIALYDLSRHFWAHTWLTHVRPLDHGLKMTSAYFAMMSAGIGNVFRDWQPWSQIGPSVLGTLVIIAILITYSTRRRNPSVAT
jgi:uncharacterized membrane protein